MTIETPNNTYDSNCNACSHQPVCRYIEMKKELDNEIKNSIESKKEQCSSHPFSATLRCTWYERKTTATIRTNTL